MGQSLSAGHKIQIKKLLFRIIKLKRVLVIKWFVLVFVGAVFIALAGCGTGELNQQQLESAMKTLVVTAYTPTIINTPDPMENILVMVLNSSLANTNQLSQVLEAKYYIYKVVFLGNALQQPDQFFVEIHCECVGNDSCCNLKRTFVMLTDAMKSRPDISLLLPFTIKTLQVSYYDHEKPMGTISVPWYLMLQYFDGTINGLQLGGEINKLATPTP
jgi:hypothetical protein